MVDRIDDKAARELCPACRSEVSVGTLHTCMICRTLFCHHCAVPGYGRQFCSPLCRDYFFYGDGEESDREA